MYIYSGSVMVDNQYLGHSDMTVPYRVNCCGYIKIDNLDVSLNRTRKDFYLIYLINGAGHYITENGTITVKAGSIITYRPGQHQNYYYKAAEKTEIYWIHFTGNQADQLMDELDFTGYFHEVGINTEYMELFESIIHELQVKKPVYQQFCTGYLLKLLSSLSRNAGLLRKKERVSGTEQLEAVIKSINEEFQKERPVEYYARQANLSLFQFIRSFKKLTMYPPARYIEKLRIAKAKELLSDSSLSIKEISGIVGYKDPFYFSKVFKKATNVTPSEFRGRY